MCGRSSASASVSPSCWLVGQQRRAACLVVVRAVGVAAAQAERVAGQRVPVGMQPVAGQTDQHVAGRDRFAGDRALAIDHADDRAGEVEFAGAVEIGHVGRFAAQQRQAGVAAGFGDAGDDGHLLVFRQPVAGEVVEKEERLGAGGEDVVDRVIDEVAADPVEASRETRQQHLGADAVRRGDQRGPLPAAQVEQAAEGADRADLLGATGQLGEFAVARDQAIVRVDIDANCAVARRARRLGPGSVI